MGFFWGGGEKKSEPLMKEIRKWETRKKKKKGKREFGFFDKSPRCDLSFSEHFLIIRRFLLSIKKVQQKINK